MKSAKAATGMARSVFALVLASMTMVAAVAPARAACEFAAVKQQIDIVIEKDAQKAAKFRSEVADGSDSIAVVERLVNEDMRNKLDICRFEASEYLTKRGFPPFH